MVFGLCTLLGLYFAPRIKDLKDKRLFYLDREDIQHYEHVGPLLAGGGKTNATVVEGQWETIINLAAAMEMGVTPPSRILRKLLTRGDHDDLFRAMQQVGRPGRLTFLLDYWSDIDPQNQVERRNNKTENFHSLADRVLFGQKEALRLRDYRDQLNRATCLRLACMLIILHHAACLQEARARWAGEGYTISNETLSHVFPTFSEHIQFLGDYSFKDQSKFATKIGRLPLYPVQAEYYDLPIGQWRPQ